MTFLIVRACFYPKIADSLLTGAKEVLEKAGMGYRIYDVPGALEIPPAIAIAHEERAFDGYIALGCVIRGETAHYDIVAEHSAGGLMDLSLNHKLAIGNGILTCETMTQAIMRSDPKQKNKGGGAALACLALFQMKEKIKMDKNQA